MNLPNCCKKCHGYYVEPKHEYFPLCNNSACECHKVLAAPKSSGDNQLKK